MFKVLKNGTAPTRWSKYSACVDLFASEDCVIGAGETVMVGLGICINTETLIDRMIERSSGMWIEEELIEQKQFLKNSHYLQLMLNDKLSEKGLIQPTVKIINLDYKDEIKVLIHNPIGCVEFDLDSAYLDLFDINGCENFAIKKGDKIAQITLLEHKGYIMNIKSDVIRDGGFGSTDK